jgi:methylase of polypeptide subunit release factors
MSGAGDDAYGEELQSFLARGDTTEIVERNDGYIDAHQGILSYFAPFEEWSDPEKAAMTLVHGRVLDVGAGAGRVALHVQSRGQECIAIDNSPGAVEVCRTRGVEDARLLPSDGPSYGAVIRRD